MNPSSPRLLFVINPGSGDQNTNYHAEIKKYLEGKKIDYDFFEMPHDCKVETIQKKIGGSDANIVVAVGGDGTVKMVAESLEKSEKRMGIIPAGSANGLAKELGIDGTVSNALDIILQGEAKKLHMVDINGEQCLHLSDIGFNAFLVKKFEAGKGRGMWGYLKAAWKVLWNHRNMIVKLETDKEQLMRKAVMVVIANATQYGTGVKINPEGSLTDNHFEVIIVRKISLGEIFKMRVSHQAFDPSKTEVLKTRSLQIESKHPVHFQVDGEYLGKINAITAVVSKSQVNVIIPPGKKV